MRTVWWAMLMWVLCGSAPAWAGNDTALRTLLRAQAFNKEFEGFDSYDVLIEEDRAFDNGSREVTAVAVGKFLDHHKRLKVLFLVAGDLIIGGQILEGTDLPPCVASGNHPASSL
ncbi:hypothetical protein DNFV4_00950 [Nitrospira tepida]|uniref:Uncharacterized protein n=1 Tax=Nitrospira tepida TaxID=2973512 RepID=A0AA86MWX9_9BACT|nr:hypothetical protein [Nitrospira tepida]CAI4030522.1 hypothetical protein DNFV4_00950 [Nitrospira tepida]